MTYAEFLASKSRRAQPEGIDVDPARLHKSLFPFQRDCTVRALAAGRMALFQGCGLGKSAQAIEWAWQVSQRTHKPVMILTPLAVAPQFVREGERLGRRVRHVREPADMFDGARIVVTNYERLDKFEQTICSLGGVVLDESSILKNFDGKTRSRLIELFSYTPFKLCATATPAPNDPAELGNHAEFLGIMRHVDMLNRFFEHDAGDTGNWVLKGHGRKPFWRWVASWAVCINKPSDMGYSDEGYELPPLELHEHVVDVDQHMAHKAGMLFAYEATSLNEQREVRKASQSERVEKAAAIVNADREQWLVWGALNPECEALAKAIDGAVDVSGSDSPDEKEAAVLDFLDGKRRVLVSKMRILGFGLNAQCCARQLFVGSDHSFEAQYQAIRRSWRFGQKRPVHVHQICTSADGRVVANIRRKQREYETMHQQMSEVIRGV
jgi:SNF2-related domain